jgi:ADP-heptose:LPS heptosyltransferase
LDTLGIIKNCKLFLGTDSGLYHCANALEVKNIVLFTATSIVKNYDNRFHKYSTILGRDDLDCRPCQAARRWAKDCKSWECQRIDPKLIVGKIKELL